MRIHNNLDFYRNLNPDPNQGSQTMRIHADLDPDPDLGQTLKSRKVKFLHGNYT